MFITVEDISESDTEQADFDLSCDVSYMEKNDDEDDDDDDYKESYVDELTNYTFNNSYNDNTNITSKSNDIITKIGKTENNKYILVPKSNEQTIETYINVTDVSNCVSQSKGSFICNICNKKIGDKYSFKSHYKKHFPEECVKCKYCDKYFACNVQLKSHQKIHSEDRPFKCNDCPYNTKTLDNLKVTNYAYITQCYKIKYKIIILDP